MNERQACSGEKKRRKKLIRTRPGECSAQRDAGEIFIHKCSESLQQHRPSRKDSSVTSCNSQMHTIIPTSLAVSSICSDSTSSVSFSLVSASCRASPLGETSRRSRCTQDWHRVHRNRRTPAGRTECCRCGTCHTQGVCCLCMHKEPSAQAPRTRTGQMQHAHHMQQHSREPARQRAWAFSALSFRPPGPCLCQDSLHTNEKECEGLFRSHSVLAAEPDWQEQRSRVSSRINATSVCIVHKVKPPYRPLVLSVHLLSSLHVVSTSGAACVCTARKAVSPASPVPSLLHFASLCVLRSVCRARRLFVAARALTVETRCRCTHSEIGTESSKCSADRVQPARVRRALWSTHRQGLQPRHHRPCSTALQTPHTACCHSEHQTPPAKHGFLSCLAPALQDLHEKVHSLMWTPPHRCELK